MSSSPGKLSSPRKATKTADEFVNVDTNDDQVSSSHQDYAVNVEESVTEDTFINDDTASNVVDVPVVARRGRGRPPKTPRPPGYVPPQTKNTRKVKQEDDVSAKDVVENIMHTPKSELDPRLRKIADMALAPVEGRRRSRLREVKTEESSSGYVCTHPECCASFETAAAKNYHMREDHPGYKEPKGCTPSATTPSFPSSAASTPRQGGKRGRPSLQKQPPPVQHEKGVMSPPVLPHTATIPVGDSAHDDIPPALDFDDSHLPDVEESDDDMSSDGDYVGVDGGVDDANKRVEPAMSSSTNATVDYNSLVPMKRGRGRPRKDMNNYEPSPRSKVAMGVAGGRYGCYIDECPWRGNYRSMRSAHMKYMHKDWVRPPRFILNRISRTGEMLPDGVVDGEEGRYACFLESCGWRGNYRASRSQHMRTQHKDWVPLRTRSAVGGYVPNGRYPCHVQGCEWRGASRSTRSNHIRKEHHNFINHIYTSRQVPCSDCQMTLTSHKLFVDHMVCEHRIGGIVQREFTDVRDYEEWFDAVQDSFTIDFVKRMGVKQTREYQVLYLYCARGGGYRDERIQQVQRERALAQGRKRISRIVPKCGRNCAAFLRVLHWTDGRLTVMGCVEHTGHRMGTPLMRLAPMEREVMDEYLYVMDEDTTLDMVLDRLREVEGFTVDGYDVTDKTTEDVRKYVTDEDEVVSIVQMLGKEELAGATYNVNIENPDEGVTIGLMDEGQKELWRQHAHKGVCIEEVRLVLGKWDVRLFLVLVFDEQEVPRCVTLYLTSTADRVPLLQHLKTIWMGAIDTIVTDCSPDYPGLIGEHWGEEVYGTDMQLAEWHLLSEWAAITDQYVVNRVDRFTIMCALRRWVRSAEPIMFEAIANELFDALREMELDEYAQFVDSQVSDQEFSKRWQPGNRNPLTDHINPLLEMSCRILRERYLSCELCSRLDEYVGLMIGRIAEFNAADISTVYATRPQDPPRSLPQDMYMEMDGEVIDPRTGMIVSGVEGLEGAGLSQSKRIKMEVDGQLIEVEEEHEIVEEVIPVDDDMLVVGGEDGEGVGEEGHMDPQRLMHHTKKKLVRLVDQLRNTLDVGDTMELDELEAGMMELREAIGESPAKTARAGMERVAGEEQMHLHMPIHHMHHMHHPHMLVDEQGEPLADDVVEEEVIEEVVEEEVVGDGHRHAQAVYLQGSPRRTPRQRMPSVRMGNCE